MFFNPSFAEFLVFLAYYVIASALLRVLMGRFPDSPFGKALAYIN